jgi:hypothetical protein
VSTTPSIGLLGATLISVALADDGTCAARSACGEKLTKGLVCPRWCATATGREDHRFAGHVPDRHD